jgi:aryl-alcohol dehydrogenase-like predicted oxidoreductase
VIAPIVGTTQPERIDEYLGALHLDIDLLAMKQSL